MRPRSVSEIVRILAARVTQALPGLALAAAFALPGASRAVGQIPAPARSRDAIVVGADWLQATALPLDRNTMQSSAADVDWRRGNWSLSAGWLRIARTLSTVEGGTVSAGRLVHAGRVLLVPTVSVLGGSSYESRDTTGYDWTNGQGATGHVPRYSYSNAATIGGGVGLTVEVPVYRWIGVRAMGSEWAFSGKPVSEDRARAVAGVGLSLRVR